MFNIGWAEFLVLTVAGLFIIGPERLPSAAAWLGRSIRQLREYATGAREQLRDHMGPEFDEPLEELRRLRRFNPRGFTPRSSIAHLLDDMDDDPLDRWIKPNGYAAPTGLGLPVLRPLQPGERAPFDPDAT
jgi:sec-independent protein translocase protein TatB